MRLELEFVWCLFSGCYPYCCLRCVTLCSSFLFLFSLGGWDRHLWICLLYLIHFPIMGHPTKGFENNKETVRVWHEKICQSATAMDLAFCFSWSTTECSTLYQDISSTGFERTQRVAHTGSCDSILWSCIMMAMTEEQWEQNGIIFKLTC